MTHLKFICRWECILWITLLWELQIYTYLVLGIYRDSSVFLTPSNNNKIIFFFFFLIIFFLNSFASHTIRRSKIFVFKQWIAIVFSSSFRYTFSIRILYYFVFCFWFSVYVSLFLFRFLSLLVLLFSILWFVFLFE